MKTTKRYLSYVGIGLILTILLFSLTHVFAQSPGNKAFSIRLLQSTPSPTGELEEEYWSPGTRITISVEPFKGAALQDSPQGQYLVDSEGYAVGAFNGMTGIIIEGPESSYYDWYFVRLDNGAEGWITSSSFTVETGSVQVDTIESGFLNATVDVESASLYSGPGANHREIGSVPYGKWLTITAQAKDNENRIWYLVNRDDGSPVWIGSWLLRELPNDVIVKPDVTVPVPENLFQGIPIVFINSVIFLIEPMGVDPASPVGNPNTDSRGYMGEPGAMVGTTGTILFGPLYRGGWLWYQVRLDSGEIGWVVLEAIEALSPQSSAPTYTPTLEQSQAFAPSPTATSLSTNNPGKVMTRDDFSENTLDWETADEPGLFSGLSNGVYVIDFSHPDYQYWVIAPGFTDRSRAPVLNAPYELQLEVSNARHTGGEFNLVILFDVGPNYDTFKRINIGQDSTWKLVEWNGAHSILAQGPLEDGPVNFLDGRTHTVSLKVETDAYTLLVDDEIKAKMPSYGPISGTVGFGLDRGEMSNAQAYAIFDNLVIYSLRP